MMAQQLDYFPKQRPDVSDEDYQHARMVLEETYAKIKKYGDELTYADYWNISMAYFTTKEDAAKFRELLYKSKEMAPRKFAEVFLKEDFGGSDPAKWEGYLTENEFYAIREDCKAILMQPKAQEEETAGQVEKEIRMEQANLMLRMQELQEKDQRFRSSACFDLVAQRVLDEENLEAIDSLYKQYQCYLGQDLVTEKYAYVMWSVIQHSNLEAMERYLPVIVEAVKKSQLKKTMLHLLIDRIYTIKCAYQIYGTQAGVPIGPADETDPIRKKYELKENIRNRFLRGEKLKRTAKAPSYNGRKKGLGH